MSSPPVNFYADFQGLASLRNDARAQDPATLKEAAKQFESLFTQMLLKSMRQAGRSFGDSLFGSDQADFYQEMFDDQIAMQLSQGKGLGLAQMLIRQLGEGAGPEGRRASLGEGSQILAPPARGPASTGSSGARTSSLSSSKADFVRTFLPHAQEAARALGVDPRALLAQAALETGWGRSVPCDAQGQCSFNFFGIKAGSQWSGPTVSMPTLEFEEGVAVRRVERFRSYGCAADSFRDYAELVRNNSRYRDALGAGGDIASFAAALQQGGYATDPAYAQKIVAVADEVRSLSAPQPDTAAALPLDSIRGG